MVSGASVGVMVEMLIFLAVGAWFLYLQFNPKNRTVLTNVPIVGKVFEYKYSFLIVGLVLILNGLLQIRYLI